MSYRLVIQVYIALPSGKRKSLSVPQSSKVGDLKRLAQRSFEHLWTTFPKACCRGACPCWSCPVARCWTPRGWQPDSHSASNRDCINRPCLCPLVPWVQQNCDMAGSLCWREQLWNSRSAYRCAATPGDRACICSHPRRWIDRGMGWSTIWRWHLCSQRAAQECSTYSVHSTCMCWNPWRCSVVTWGHAPFGGDSSAVQDELRGVQQIQATRAAFAAILADGSVVTWGNPEYGGDSSAVKSQLRSVQQIQSTDYAFAPFWQMARSWPGVIRILVVTAAQSRSSSGVSNRFSPHEAFAAILGDGSVITWRHRGHGIPSEAQDQLRNVQQIQCTDYAFSAIRADGSALTWGNLSSCRFGGFQVQALRPRQRVEDKRQESRPSQESEDSVPDSGHTCCVHRNFGRWIGRYLGGSRFWGRQLCSLRWAQGRAADPSHACCICPGAIHVLVVTALRSKTSSGVCSGFKPHIGRLLPFWLMDLWSPGPSWLWWWQFLSPRSPQRFLGGFHISCAVCFPLSKIALGQKQQALSKTSIVCTSGVVCGVLKRPPDPPSWLRLLSHALPRGGYWV